MKDISDETATVLEHFQRQSRSEAAIAVDAFNTIVRRFVWLQEELTRLEDQLDSSIEIAPPMCKERFMQEGLLRAVVAGGHANGDNVRMLDRMHDLINGVLNGSIVPEDE